MKVLKPTEIKSLEQFFQLKQDNLLKIMSKYLKGKYKTVYTTPQYVVAIGDIPVGIVAHMDTVFTSPPYDIFYDRVKNVMWSPDGLGADDRAGVYSIVQLVKQGFRPTIILTTDEEKGALGADRLVKDFPSAPTDLKYLIELDRRGSNDCVFYECNNPEFEEYIEKFDFVTNFGTFSDISVISPAWKIAGVNLSIGYVNEHSYTEILYINNMLSTIKKVGNMLEDIKNVNNVFEFIPYSYQNKFNNLNYDWDPSYGISKDLWNSWHIAEPIEEEIKQCRNCDIYDYEYNLFPVKTKTKTIYLCADCVGLVSQNNKIKWCSKCKEPFLVDLDYNKEICYSCEEENNDRNNTEN